MPEQVTVERFAQALEGDEFVLYYQPVVDLEGPKVVGVEALLRWIDPEKGLIPPLDFIPAAEETGAIVDIGAWVVREAARQSAVWRAQGFDLEVAVNVSPRQLQVAGFPEAVAEAVAVADVDPATFVLEITESAALDDPDRFQSVMWDLYGRGFRMSLDDFGTGYSSLSRLKDLPFSTLKIDRAFIDQLPDDPRLCGIVRAVVHLAHSLQMQPLAEGIETEAQWRFLAENFMSDAGPPLGQGFYFAKPVSASDLDLILKDGLRM